MRRHKPKWFYNDTLKINLWVSYGLPPKKYAETAKFQFNHEVENVEKLGGNAMEIPTEKGMIHWLWTKKKDPAVLAHEAVHIAIMALQNKGINPNDSDGELCAYLVEWIMNMALGRKIS
jgi:hypothetical protein